MTRSSTPASAVAAARLALTSGHLNNPTGSSCAFSTSATSRDMQDIKNVTVFGAGLMGAGIAQVAAHVGFKVTLCDVTDDALTNGKKIIESSIQRLAKKSPNAPPFSSENVFSNINTTTDPSRAVSEADLVVEAIVENLKVKQDLFKLLDGSAPKSCVFATNTSSLSVREIAESCSDDRRKRPQMKLVEVVKAPETAEETVEALLDVCKKMDKTAVRCTDTPGFIVNRLLVPYMFEAIKMVERGDASAADVDVAMKLGAGHPMGPLQLADFVGLDTCYHIMSGWREKVENGEDVGLSKDLVAESKMLTDLVAAGKLGRKSGEGFFKYEK
ncbi:hypothetical protein FRC05_006956 [Tulasnella sp. 425]|nr:hypothetical protein FRC05_006956 [Tulasnella sp. 425]